VGDSDSISIAGLKNRRHKALHPFVKYLQIGEEASCDKMMYMAEVFLDMSIYGVQSLFVPIYGTNLAAG
jgi:hypothetical protein